MTQGNCKPTTLYSNQTRAVGRWFGLAVLALAGAAACGEMDDERRFDPEGNEIAESVDSPNFTESRESADFAESADVTESATASDDIASVTQAIISSTPWISDENGAAYCPQGTAMMGIRCSGRFCDNVAMYCDDYPGLTGASYWTSWFSEEGSNYRACANDEVVTGIDCAYRFCDRIRFRCTRTSARLNTCAWSGEVSEENRQIVGSPARFVQGISCRGSYCDNKKLLYCNSTTTCNGRCGGNAGSCWCDSVCTRYGDCCADKVDRCGP